MEGGADPEFFNSTGPLRGVKRDLYEGGIRVPMIAWWPGRVAAGSRSDHVSAFWDVLPTVCELAGVAAPEASDGISFLPELCGGKQAEHPHLYWEFTERGGKQAVRLDVMKNLESPMELYDLEKDLGETTDVSGAHPEIVAEIDAIMEREHEVNPDFPLFAREKK